MAFVLRSCVMFRRGRVGRRLCERRAECVQWGWGEAGRAACRGREFLITGVLCGCGQ